MPNSNMYTTFHQPHPSTRRGCFNCHEEGHIARNRPRTRIEPRPTAYTIQNTNIQQRTVALREVPNEIMTESFTTICSVFGKIMQEFLAEHKRMEQKMAERDQQLQNCGHLISELQTALGHRITHDIRGSETSSEQDKCTQGKKYHEIDETDNYAKFVHHHRTAMNTTARENVQAAQSQNKQKEQYDQTVKMHDYYPGDRLLVRNPKHEKGINKINQTPWLGPKIVDDVRGTGALVRSERQPRSDAKLVHINRTKPLPSTLVEQNASGANGEEQSSQVDKPGILRRNSEKKGDRTNRRGARVQFVDPNWEDEQDEEWEDALEPASAATGSTADGPGTRQPSSGRM